MKFKNLFFVCCLAAYASAADFSYSPVTANATEPAKKLYNFLAINYGAKTISGMMTGEMASTMKSLPDVDSFYVRTGKYPALVGLDFLFATGSNASDSWYQQYTQSSIDAAKDIWANGGIPAFTWHWKDPSDSVDAFYATQGSAGAGNDFTTFDFTQGFTDPACTSNCSWNTGSTVYKQLVSDIDEIAAYFLQLQEAGVAAIFRPIHEAAGGWFWWGTKNGAAFQALYNLIYDEMVTVKGVKNLVWVWNPQFTKNTDWNPGDTKYDVLSLDIYEAWDYTSKYTTAYSELKTNFNNNKIFAISENGPIPDVSAMHAAGTMWSWWMPWYQTWDGKFLNQTVDAVWKANVESECVITLDEMPGWDKYTISTTPVAKCTPEYSLTTLDTARPVIENVPGDTATNAWLRVHSTAGVSDTANGNVIVATGNALDYSSATTITIDVFNGNPNTGFWFTIAFLGNESQNWSWAQPDGCWVNSNDSTQCVIDLKTLAKNNQILTGADYTTFLKNVSKVYIEIFAEGFSGSMYFDNLKIGSSVVDNFNTTTKKYSIEQDYNIDVIEIIGMGKQPTALAPMIFAKGTQISWEGKMLSLSVPQAGPANVAIFDLQGNRVMQLARGSLSAGTHAYSLNSLSHGVYIVRAVGKFGSLTQKISIR